MASTSLTSDNVGMHAISYVRQSTGYTCGPAALSMWLAYHGVRRTEQQLARLLHTNATYGSTRANMKNVARSLGISVRAGGMSLRELRSAVKDEPIIVSYVEPSEGVGHYAVVLALNDDHIILADPWNGERFRLSVRDFSRRWLGHKTRNPRVGWTMTSR